MQLEWVPSLKTVRIVFTEIDNPPIDFICGTWSRTRVADMVLYLDNIDEHVNPDIFNTINTYLRLQKGDVRQSIEQLYLDMYSVLSYERDVYALDCMLNQYIYTLLQYFDWDTFKEWCKTSSELNFAIGIKDTLGDKDAAEITYFTKEYEDILIFSVLLKLILPVWGMYCNAMQGVLGSHHVLIHAVELIYNPYTEVNPAYNRLDQYVRAFVNGRIKTTGFSIVNDIGSEEIPDYLLAFVLWKKVCIFDGRAVDKSIVRDMHAVLKDRCDWVSRGGPNQKIALNAQGEEISIVDTYKIVQRIPPAIEVMVSVFVKDYITRCLDPTLSNEEVSRVADALPVNKQLLGFHVPVMGLVLGNSIGIRNILLLRNKQVRTIIALSSLLLRKWGYPILSELLISTPQTRDKFSLSFAGNMQQIPLLPEYINQLNKCYSIVATSASNPGIDLILTLVAEMNTYTWPTLTTPIGNVSNELAKLILYSVTKPSIGEIIYENTNTLTQ